MLSTVGSGHVIGLSSPPTVSGQALSSRMVDYLGSPVSSGWQPLPVPKRKPTAIGGQGKDVKGSLFQVLDANLLPIRTPRKRKFTRSEKRRINKVRRVGACEKCRKKHRKVG